MITHEADYAVRIVAWLAAEPRGAPLSSTSLAKETGIPYRFLRKIVRRLGKAGILRSARGREGGVALRRRPAKITLLDAIQAVDARGARVNLCVLQPDPCPRSRDCRAHVAFERIQAALTRELAKVSFQSIAQDD